jgi:hypothetical protein
LYGVAEVARRCGLSEPAIQARHHKHGIGQQIGRAIIFTHEEMLQLLDWPHRQGRPPLKKKEGAVAP